MIAYLFVVDISNQIKYQKLLNPRFSPIPKKEIEKLKAKIVEHCVSGSERFTETYSEKDKLTLFASRFTSGYTIATLAVVGKQKVNFWSFLKSVDDEVSKFNLSDKAKVAEFERALSVLLNSLSSDDIMNKIEEKTASLETKVSKLKEQNLKSLNDTLTLTKQVDESLQMMTELQENSAAAKNVLYWHNKKLMIFTTGLAVIVGLNVLLFILNFVV